MKILLIEPNYLTRYKPLGLMRISSLHKAKGNIVKFIKGNDLQSASDFGPDEIWITSLFTFCYPETISTVRFYKKHFSNKRIIIGGILASCQPELFKKEGIEVHVGLLPEAEEYPPDYDLFPDIDHSLSFTARGCKNHCPFCLIGQGKYEPKFYHRDNWIQDINPKFKKLVFWDNNFLALDDKTFKKDVKILKELVKKYNIISIDFNQGIEAKLFTEEKAKLLEGLPIKPIRFAFDHMGEDGHFQRAAELSKKYGFANISVYILYNWMDTPEDLYYRMKTVSKYASGGGGCGFLMKYQPLNALKRGVYIGKHWTKKEVMAIQKINPYPYGQVSSKTDEEFEYFFGKDATEFKKLLNFKDIKKLTLLKSSKFNKQKLFKV